MQSLKSIRLAEVDNFFKQSFEQKKLIPLYQVSAKSVGAHLGSSGYADPRGSLSQPSLPCKMYDEIGLGLLRLA